MEAKKRTIRRGGGTLGEEPSMQGTQRFCYLWPASRVQGLGLIRGRGGSKNKSG